MQPSISNTKTSPQTNSAFRLYCGWTLISVLAVIMVTRHFIWISFCDFSVWQSLQHFCSIKKVAEILKGYLKPWSVIWGKRELFQYWYWESLIRSKVCKEKCRQWENTVEDLGGDTEKCYRKFGIIFNFENWAQTSDFPSVLTASSQENYTGPHIDTQVLWFQINI